MIVTNPNCSTIVMTLALAPLKQFGIKRIVATTLQAISGAGYPGVASMDITANVVPFIGGEEPKMESETQKILGDYADGEFRPLEAGVSAHCNRVPVVDGHMVCVSMDLSKNRESTRFVMLSTHTRVCRSRRNFQVHRVVPFSIWNRQDRPQPRRDVDRDNGMTVTVGRLRECPVFDYKFVACGHNTVRGAAGAAVLNAELMYSEGFLERMIVMKFGGTSVESAVAIRRVASIVQARLNRRPVVVVSAMGKTTNKLLTIANDAARGERDDALDAVEALRDFHLREGRELVPDGRRSADMVAAVTSLFEELEELIKGIAILGELTPRATDAVSSYGERLSSVICHYAFEHMGISSSHIDARDVIVTDGRHTQAAPLLTQTYARLQATIPPRVKDGVVVMGGFIGATEEGITSTLGRGGSDFSAAIVGAGIGAQEIQIWTDVDGMLTADPTVLPGGHRVRQYRLLRPPSLHILERKCCILLRSCRLLKRIFRS